MGGHTPDTPPDILGSPFCRVISAPATNGYTRRRITPPLRPYRSPPTPRPALVSHETQDYFARLPGLRLSEFTPVSVRVYGDFATQAGTYTFAWRGTDGAIKEKRARFSFTFRRDPESPTGWTIVEHHSSSMPISPVELKHVVHSVLQ